MTLSVIDTQSESFLNQNITTFPESPQRREGGGTMTRVGGNGEAVSTSHFLRNPNTNNRHEEIEQFRNRRVRQKSGKTVNNKHSVFQDSMFSNGKWISNITDSVFLFNSIFNQEILDSQYGNGRSSSPLFETSNIENDELVGRNLPKAKLINSQTSEKHDNNDDEVNAVLAQKQKLAKVIFFSFATLHEFLTDADQNLSQGSRTTLQNTGRDIKEGHKKYQNLVLNSRIISASIDEKILRRRSNQKYFYNTMENEPNPAQSSPVVNIEFTHLHEKMSDPICVYWNNDKESWSDHGCFVVKSSKKSTTCQCNHLTHFALLMRYPEDMDIRNIGSGIIFNSVSDDVYSERNEDAINASTVITLEIATYIISTVCLVILILLIIQVRKYLLHILDTVSGGKKSQKIY